MNTFSTTPIDQTLISPDPLKRAPWLFLRGPCTAGPGDKQRRMRNVLVGNMTP